jgi:hypothetical protein
MAVVTLSKLVRGSPIPIMTTLLMILSSFGSRPKALFANQTWPMISETVRFRLNPCLPVEQKAQSSAQPAWDDTHNVRDHLPDKDGFNQIATTNIDQEFSGSVFGQLV